jgi:nitroimidazol reductase NimA-like FMN-containing flavoprotein (pyridoxamine 5'-phosphate oxidase superfamily)
VVPVNYVMDGDAVLLRIAPGSGLARRLGPTPASFQLDEFDPFTQSGWSVLVRGRASEVDPAEHPAAARLQSWAEGQRTVHVRLEATEVSGRRLLEA